MNGDPAIQALGSEPFLRFLDLRAGPSFNAVTILVDGAVVAAHRETGITGNEGVDRVLGAVQRVETVPGCMRYQVIFENAVAYTWREESFVIPEKDEDFSTSFRQYQTSAYLDFVRSTTTAQHIIDAPLRHYAVVTMDAVIDVICTAPPSVTAREVGPDDPGPLPGRPVEYLS